MRIQRVFPWIGAVAIWAMAFLGLRYVLDAYEAHPDGNLSSVVGYLAALLALAGWMVQAFLGVKTSQKQHSINVLFNSRMSPEYQKNLKLINDLFPGRSRIALDVVNKPEHKDEYNALVFVLNYYEFISVGIWHGDLNDSIIRECIRSQLLNFTTRASEFISVAREEDQNGRPSRQRQLTFKNLCRLRSQWQATLWRETGTWPTTKEHRISN